MPYGVRTYSSTGSLRFDSTLQAWRKWHEAYIADSASNQGDYYYDQPLDHEPALIVIDMRDPNAAFGSQYRYKTPPVSHLTSGGQWTGLHVDAPGVINMFPVWVVAYAKV